MNRADFRFADRLRVRWAEVDMQKIVFNGHYLMYFDTAVAGWWRAMGLPYEQTMHDLGGDFYVRKATVEYEGSARYDDQLEVGVRCERIGTSSMRLQTAAFRGGERLVTGELVYVWADPATQRAQPVPGTSVIWQVRRLLEASRPGVLATDLEACNTFRLDPGWLRQILCPALVVAGARDRMAPARKCVELATVLGGEAVTMAGSGHMMMIEEAAALRRLLFSRLGDWRSRAA